jgi:hypothetical protein
MLIGEILQDSPLSGRRIAYQGVVTMAFGKRQSGVGATAQALNGGMVGVQSQVVTEPVAETQHPFRSLIGLLLCAAGLYWLIATYSRDIARDHILHGTWQPAYDLRATDGKCSRTNFVLTTCTANVKSVARPDQAPISLSFMMLFSGGGGEVLIPVRSTKDREAVSIYYSAETKLWNRTLSFVFFVSAVTLFGVIALFSLLRAVNS